MAIRYGIGIWVAAVVLGGWCSAGSIYAKRLDTQRTIYADDKAIRVGDVLTIIINEAHKVDNKVERDLSRSSKNSLSLGDKDISVEDVITSVPHTTLNTASEKKLNGQSDYKDERSIEDRITVVVEDIHPNGNLVVIGTRSREINEDKQTIQVSGIVRPSDISYDNTIRSEQVAMFQLVTIIDGPTKDYTKQGWLGKILDFVWPF